MKITIDGYVAYTKYAWDDKPTYSFFTFDPTVGGGDWVIVMNHSFEVEIPDNFDPRPGQVANLKTKKEKIQAEMTERITTIDKAINSLLAIEA
jgi:hypothetical protein